MAFHLARFWDSASAAGAFEFAFVESHEPATSTGTTISYGTRSIGAAHSQRSILVGSCARSGATTATLASGTLGGNAGTVFFNAVNTGGGNGSYTSFILFPPSADPGGTSANITLTYNANISIGSGICIWRLLNVSNILTPEASDSDIDGLADGIGLSVNVNAGDGVFGGYYAHGGGGGTWDAGIDEDAEILTLGGGGSGVWGSRLQGSTATPLTVTGNPSSDNIRDCGGCIVVR